MKRYATSLVASALFYASVLPLSGDSGTRVTSGALMFASHVGVIDIAGQHGFRMRANVDDVGGIFAPANQCGDLDCVPGTMVNLEAKWSGLDLRGTLLFKGQSYPLGSEGTTGALGLVDFEGSLVLPPFNDRGTVDVDAPFTLTGFVEFEDTLAREPISGAGVATLQFKRSADGSAWQFSNATYAIVRQQ